MLSRSDFPSTRNYVLYVTVKLADGLVYCLVLVALIVPLIIGVIGSILAGTAEHACTLGHRFRYWIRSLMLSVLGRLQTPVES